MTSSAKNPHIYICVVMSQSKCLTSFLYRKAWPNYTREGRLEKIQEDKTEVEMLKKSEKV